MKKRSISAKLVAQFVVLVLVISIVITAAGIIVGKGNMEESKKDEVGSQANRMAAKIEQKLQDN